MTTPSSRPLEGRGADLAYGRRLYRLLCAQGLVDVAAEGYLAIAPGGSSNAAQRLTRYEQIGGELVAAGRITAAELDRACALLRDPACPVLTPGLLISVRGQRPRTVSDARYSAARAVPPRATRAPRAPIDRETPCDRGPAVTERHPGPPTAKPARAGGRRSPGRARSRAP